MPPTALTAAPRPPHPALLAGLQRTQRARLRNSQAIARLEAAQASADHRDWAAERRARTRHLIELGGLVQKAGLVALTDDDRATLFGALLQLAGRLRDGDEDGTTPAQLSARWRHAGLRAFHAERESEAEDAGLSASSQDLPS